MALCVAALLLFGSAALADSTFYQGNEVSGCVYLDNQLASVAAGDNWTLCIDSTISPNVITFRNFQNKNLQIASQNAFLYTQGDMKLVLEGKNEIKVTKSTGESGGVICSLGDMTIVGSGSLDIRFENGIDMSDGAAYGTIVAIKTLTMKSGEVKIAHHVSPDSGTSTNNPNAKVAFGLWAFELKMEGGKLEASASTAYDDGSAVAVTAAKKLTMNSGSLIAKSSVPKFDPEAASIGLLVGGIEANGGYLSAEGSMCGIWVSDDLIPSSTHVSSPDDGNIVVAGGKVRGVKTNRGETSLRTGAVDVGIRLDHGNITVTGGELYGEAQSNGIIVHGGNITVLGGRLEGKARDHGLYGRGIYASAIFEDWETGEPIAEGKGGYFQAAEGLNIYCATEYGAWAPGKIDINEARTPANAEDIRVSSIYTMDANAANIADKPHYHTAVSDADLMIAKAVPNTGDGAAPMLWVGMMLLAGAALLLLKKRSIN